MEISVGEKTGKVILPPLKNIPLNAMLPYDVSQTSGPIIIYDVSQRWYDCKGLKVRKVKCFTK